MNRRNFLSLGAKATFGAPFVFSKKFSACAQELSPCFFTVDHNASSIKDNTTLRSASQPAGRLMNVWKNALGFKAAVQLDNSGRMHEMKSRIIDIAGKQIRLLSHKKTRGERAYLEWDGKNEKGKRVNPGIYVWQIWINGKSHTDAVRVHM